MTRPSAPEVAPSGSGEIDLHDPEFLKKLEALNRLLRKVLSGGIQGETAVGRLGQGTIFHDYQPYTGTEDPRYVDWNIFARLGDLVVKQFEAEESPEILLLLDGSASMDFGAFSKLDFSRLVAAALGYVALANLGSVSLAVAPADEPPFIHTFRGAAQTMSLFNVLSKIRPVPATEPLASVVDRLRQVRGLTGVVVLSDFYDVETLPRLLGFLRHRRARVMCVHVVADEELDPSQWEGRLVDAETGRSLNVELDRMTMTHYRRELRRHFVLVEGECKRRGVGYTRVSSKTPFEHTVFTLFRASRAKR